MTVIEKQDALQHAFVERLPPKITKLIEYIKAIEDKVPVLPDGSKLGSELDHLMTSTRNIELTSLHILLNNIYPELSKAINSPKDIAAEAIQNLRLNLEAIEDVVHSHILAYKTLSSQDDITGMPNQTRFIELLDIELSRARRQDDDLCLCLIALESWGDLMTKHDDDTLQSMMMIP